MAKAHAHSWEVTDDFWQRVEPWCPGQYATRTSNTCVVRERDGLQSQHGWFSKPSCPCSGRAASGRRSQRSALAVPARFTRNSCCGRVPGSSKRCGALRSSCWFFLQLCRGACGARPSTFHQGVLVRSFYIPLRRQTLYASPAFRADGLLTEG